MNALSPKETLAPPAARAATASLRITVATLMAEILEQQKPLSAEDDGLSGRAYERQSTRVKAMQDLLASLRANVAEESVAQLIVLSMRFAEDASADQVDDIRAAVDVRVDQLQTVIFRLLRILRLDPQKVGADDYLNPSAMEPEGYTPPWVVECRAKLDAKEAAQ
jgi:hypothetical protein